VIGLASAVAVAPRARREVSWRLAAIIGAAGIPPSIAGGIVNHRLDGRRLMLVFAALMVAAGVRMLRSNDESGGFLLVPALVVALGLRTPTAVATSLVVIVINSVAGLVPYFTAGAAAPGGGTGLDWWVIGPFAAAAILASLPAGRLARRLPASILRRGFAVLVLVVAAGVATQTVVTLAAT